MNRIFTYTICFLFSIFCFVRSSYAQVCSTPGFDGAADIGGQVNTYYPAITNTTLLAGTTSVTLAAVPVSVTFAGGVNTYSANNKSIQTGDLLLIIQMQDATINSSNSNLYGASSTVSGPSTDPLGGTGYTSLGNTGLFEYVVAMNDVPLNGGTLTFRGVGNSGAVNTYYNAAFDPTSTIQGQRTFQVVRVPQYSNVRLTSTIYAPPFNGRAGGIIAFDVSGTMNFNGKTIDASARGFRAGFGYKDPGTPANDNGTYIASSTNKAYGGKGEGIVGTPQNTWDGFIQVAAAVNAMPNGGAAKGAPGNGGGGGNNHNSGGGGGGNGGYGGKGGDGYSGFGNSSGCGGRPGSIVYLGGSPTPTRLIMGGGGGGGHVNNASLGDSGGVGGGIILVNVGTLTGAGTITSNGGAGQNAGWCGGCPTDDGGAGGGAGGTVFLKVSTPDPSSSLTIHAKGGNGGTAANSHGPGGAGGGGLIFSSTGAAGTINGNVAGGGAGTTPGQGTRGANSGGSGQALTFTISSLPSHLQGGGAVCYPELSTSVVESNPGIGGSRLLGAPVTYTITVSNKANVGNAGGVIVDVSLPSGINYQSVTVAYTGGSGGDSAVSVTTSQNTSTSATTRPRFGNFVIAPGGSVILTLLARVDCAAPIGSYSNTSSQVYYFDPTASSTTTIQRISPSPTNFPLASLSAGPISTSYDSGGSVSGTNYNGLSSSGEDVEVVASVTPTLSSSLNMGSITSSSLFSYSPTSSYSSANGGILSFSWSRGAIAGISNTAATGLGSISESLFNQTRSVINVAYTYTLLVNDCIRNNTQVVNVPVQGSVPYIISFTPLSGTVGTSLVISGQNFNPVPSKNVVYFGATSATVTNANSTTLVVRAPYGANYQYLSVTNLDYNTTGYSAQPFIITYPTGNGLLNDFAPSVDYPYSSSTSDSFGLTTKDFDGDGNADVVAIDNDNNKLFIFYNTTSLGSASISFTTKSIGFPVGADTDAVISEDIDGDGRADLAIVGYSGTRVYFYRNVSSLGSISFSYTGVTVQPSVPLRTVTFGDFDSDGKPDLVTGGDNSNIFIYRNTSLSNSFSFAFQAYASTIGVSNRMFTVGDIDGDGKPDIVGANVNGAIVFRNATSQMGMISFTPQYALVSGINAHSVALGDLNSDGKLDIVVSNSGGNTILVFPNKSISGTIDSSSFSSSVSYPTLSDPRGVSISDVDGDGLADVIVGSNINGNSISVFKNVTTSTNIMLGSRVDYFSSGSTIDAAEPVFLSLVDLNSDGKIDIVSQKNNNGSGSRFSVLRNIQLTPVVVESMSPTRGPIGQQVIISGRNFNPTSGKNVVYFGSVSASVLSGSSSTTLTVIVPYGANYQYVSVTNLDYNTTGYSTKPFVVTFATNGLTDFANNGTITTTGIRPRGIALGDFNRDGKPDLLVANDSNSSVTLYRNVSVSSGSLSFVSAVSLGLSGTSAGEVCVVDIDGDGLLDFAVTGLTSYGIQLFRNSTGNNSSSFVFSSWGTLTTPGNSFALASGDIDGDGRPDLITGHINSGVRNVISIFRNLSLSGTFSFSSRKDIVTDVGNSNADPISIAIGDLDKDSKVDLAVSNRGSNTVVILHNESVPGSISVSVGAELTGLNSPLGIAIGDMDGDSNSDILVSNLNGRVVLLFRNMNSTPGSLLIDSRPSYAFPLNSTPLFGVGASDIDGDGQVDIGVVVGNGSSNEVYVLRNMSVGVGSLGFSNRLNYMTGLYPENFVMGDMNSDGKPDIVTSNYNGSSLTLLRNIGIVNPPVISSYSPSIGSVGERITILGQNFSTNLGSNAVFFGSMSGSVELGSTSSSLLVRVPSGASYSYISVTNLDNGLTGYSLTPFAMSYRPLGDHLFRPKATLSSGSGQGSTYSVLSDLDGDGLSDLVVLNSNTTVSLFRNATVSVGSISMVSGQVLGSAVGSTSAVLSLGDIDGDGRKDIVLFNTTTNTGRLYRNMSTVGNISFTLQTEGLVSGFTPVGVRIVDIDKDGRPDILTTNYTSGTVSVFRNQQPISGLWSFSSKQDLLVGSNPRSIAVGDLDKDGGIDLVISEVGGISILKNFCTAGSISFSRITLVTGQTLGEVVLGELDGDSFLDIVVSNPISDKVTIFRSNSSVGSISFVSGMDLTVGMGVSMPLSLEVGSIDGSGKADLLVGNQSSNELIILHNESSTGSLSFTSIPDVSGGSALGVRSLSVGDLDGDNMPDMVAITNEGNNNIGIFRQYVLFPQSLTITSLTRTSVGSSISITVLRSLISSSISNSLVYRLESSVGGGSATLDNLRTLTGIHVGMITLTVTALGDTIYSSVSRTVGIEIGRGSQTLEITSNSTMVVNSSLTASVLRTSGNGSVLVSGIGGSITYSISSSVGGGSATVNPVSGLIRALSMGFVTLLVRASGDTDYYPGEGSQSLVLFLSPAGVGTGAGDMKLWLRADNGVNSVGDQVVLWEDQSQSISLTTNQAQSSPTNDIIIATNTLNYHPVLSFTGLESLRGIGDFNFSSSTTILSVSRNRLTGSSAGSVVSTSDVLGVTFGPGLLGSTGRYMLDGNGGFGGSVLSSSLASILLGQYYSNTSTSGSILYLNGVSGTVGGVGSLLSNPSSFKIGNGFTGDIEEIVYYNRGLSLQERTKVQSYMALKYGLHLDSVSEPNYIASDGSIIWDGVLNTGYTNGVIGIGIDAIGGLNQKQSSSSVGSDIVSLGIGIITSTNVGNTSNFRSNQTFILLGNNGSLTSSVTSSDLPISSGTVNPMRMRLGRIWKTQVRGIVGGIELHFDLRGSFSSTVGYEVGELCLLIDRGTGSFTSSSIGTGTLLQGASLVSVGSDKYKFRNVLLNDGDRFTLGLMKKSQSLSFSPPYTLQVGSSATITATNSALVGSSPVNYYLVSGSGSATVDGITGLVKGVGAGTVTLVAIAAANTDYVGASTSTIITITKGTPTLSFISSVTTTTVGLSLTVSATSSPTGTLASTGMISYSIISYSCSSSATIDTSTGLLITIDSGQLIIQASQGADSNYNAPAPAFLTVNILPLTPTIYYSSPICIGSSLALSTDALLNGEYSWTGPTGYLSSSQSITIDHVSSGMGGRYSVSVSKQGCPLIVSPVASVNVTVYQYTGTVNAGGDLVMLFRESKRLAASADASYVSYKWEPSTYLDNAFILNPTVIHPTSSITYRLTAETLSGCTAYSEASIWVPFSGTTNIISPNGDGINDVWEIGGISNYSNCIVKIFTSWGQVVYSSVGYKEAWNGIFQGEVLPVGTYYYMIDFGDGSKPLVGDVSVVK